MTRDGICTGCGVHVVLHFDAYNRKLSCEEARRFWRPSTLAQPSRPARVQSRARTGEQTRNPRSRSCR
jgi:hypothetical protein